MSDTKPAPELNIQNQDYFGEDIIGQHNLKQKVSFYLDSYKHNKIFPNTLLYSRRGEGKTTLARAIAQHLLGEDGKPKRFVEINGASVRNLDDFVTQIIQPFVVPDQEVTLFLDEINNVNHHTLEWLLSVLAPTTNNKTRAFYQGAQFDFNFDKFSFIAATTNKEDLSLALKNRLYHFEFEPYKPEELIRILYKNVPNVEFRDNIELEITSTVRESPRTTIMLADDIKKYLTQHGNKQTFDANDWKELQRVLNIFPLGLTISEVNLLRYLNKRGPSTLTCLSGYFGLDPKSLRREIELYPLSHGLMRIDCKRMITVDGQKLLKEIDRA